MRSPPPSLAAATPTGCCVLPYPSSVPKSPSTIRYLSTLHRIARYAILVLRASHSTIRYLSTVHRIARYAKSLLCCALLAMGCRLCVYAASSTEMA
eukprot:3941146-Rhodomonas_salina.1